VLVCFFKDFLLIVEGWHNFKFGYCHVLKEFLLIVVIVRIFKLF